MATITVKNLKITKDADKGNELCFVSFSYSIECDPTEQVLSKQGLLKFEIMASLLGYDDWFDDHLSDMPSGANHYKCGDGEINIGPVAIPCSVLNEDIGEDEIYVKVTATSVGAPGGKEYTAEGSSDSITQNF
jgi:hypothetical protein